ncbi:MAG TPA: response regulator transcription factor [Solirubrobacteraceae bacterium]|nr:response regulator transcription factor [Solirubrobacteraceae bacterium]
MPGLRILLVEDDLELRELLARGLKHEGFAVAGARTGVEAMQRALETAPDALVIDIGLPDADGRDLCQALRARGVQAPVLFLTARDAVTDRLSGFAAGGDDYVTKPFHLAEVAARLRALLARAGVTQTFASAGLALDPSSHEIAAGDRKIPLTPTEFRLIAALAGRPGDTLSRRELMRAAWPEGAIVHDNTLDVYLARLRRKLRELPDAPGITTIHGRGYRLT